MIDESNVLERNPQLAESEAFPGLVDGDKRVSFFVKN